ncbi:MAG: Maf family protein [Fervidobacterium sp.]|uniref:dTTP/UTP pyrophosphatase n=1 Tax=Fervidobacterium gondwanense DSM 13020 TaxID=1121883 RepID=A0A1M7T9V1_FERGO|nr:Maf family protein [Fervidobacterium gondwanense]UXF01028.1 septum formation inhibitor Maf [Fervidobacterium riparium]SHN67481.1 septum formation protein [Fervidobacterium gondwanense DSM 13020]
MIILGTSSPRRIELFSHFKLPFQILAPQIDEKVDETLYKTPEAVVIKIAKDKLQKICDNTINREDIDVIITADTIVWMDGRIFGKPRDSSNAKEILRELSGKWHKVFTGVCVKIDNEEFSFYEETSVKFRELEDEEIDFYVSTGEPLDKAGAYGIQELGGVLVERIEGDYTNVVGLPLPKLWKLLFDRGVIKRYATRKWSEGEAIK